ncbi:MAG: dTDP-4-dehydrorhamnose reductase [Rhodospirillaceae bacterium]|nr:dTDP-4-dehydrorhamnose reductase [Rhodospirillaceae bacterium]|tara:strand:+ start:899 stop:1801 length:903 start_codon:yes stop_codon:yes gene_type:complete
MRTGKQKILILGANGQVGKELSKRADNFEVNAIAFSRAELDITDCQAVASILENLRPHTVINAAAYTAVDDAENRPDLAYKVNRDAPENLAKTCEKLSIPIIHISTDYVFDGKKSTAYLENDVVSPLGIYGRSKEAGEAVIRDNTEKYIILRTSWVYAAHGNNFLRTMMRLANERNELNIVEDQCGVPTCAVDIADALLLIAKRINDNTLEPSWGTFHYTSKNPTTWRGFAEEIFKELQNYKMSVPIVNGILSSQYPTPALRPLNSVLNCDKIERVFSVPRRDWKEGMHEVVAQLLTNKH